MTTQRTLVTIFLRGGADGLTLLPPINDDVYRRSRPTLAVSDGHRLDDRFMLHPMLAPLAPLYDAGQMAIIPACGSDDSTRSHFYAQDLMEHGGATVAGGWIGRFLRNAKNPSAAGVLDAVTVGSAVSESLRGAPNATAFSALEDLVGSNTDRAMLDTLARWYAKDALLGAPATAAVAASVQLQALQHAEDKPQHNAEYPTEKSHGGIAADFGKKLRLIARLIQADLGMRSACVDLDGWDSHFMQSSVMAPRINALGAGLAAFITDLGSVLDHVSIVVLSEFGRRVAENTSLGTDHGRGGVTFVIGGGVKGGVKGTWPGLNDDVLEGPGDVPVTTDYRDVLWPVLQRHGATNAHAVFPEHQLRSVEI
jgi:uncharacterized protein (DUF1501 family)